MLLFVIAAGACASAKSRVTVEGSAVAVSILPLTLNGNVYADILVGRTHGKALRGEFVLVSLSVPSSQWDQWLAALPSLHRFRVRRSRNQDVSLREHLRVIDAETRKPSAENSDIPAWRLLPGHEAVRLPFGRTIAAYESADWPVLPVV